MSITKEDGRVNKTLTAQDIPPNNNPIANLAAAALPASTASAAESKHLQGWSATNVGLRLGADAASAASAAILVAPIVTVIDRSIVQKASTGVPFRNAFFQSLRPVLKAPHRFLTSKPFLLIFTVYSSTYLTANAIDTATSTLHAQPAATVSTGPAKFIATSAVNMSLSVYKDSYFARIFGATTSSNPASAVTKSIPKLSYLLFATRDSLTIFASFNLPPLLSSHLNPSTSTLIPTIFNRLLSTDSSRNNTAQFVAPAAMQLLSTPAHLLGLDLFNRQDQRLGFWERFGRVRRDWGVSALARMGRIVPAFGVGGVVNAGVRRGLMRRVEGTEER